MYQKFLLEVFYPSNLLEIFFVRELCARMARADDLFTADQKICTWAPLLEIRNQATLRHWITGITRNLAVFPGGTVQWRLGRFMRFMFMQKVRFL